jgi:hypothetical protein
MTVSIRTTRRLCGWPLRGRLTLAVALAAAVLASGCKSKDKDGGVARGSGGRSDPLLAGPGRIAPQNLPVPDRGGTAGGRRSDPLLGSPTARPTERSGYTDDPDRFRRPHIPGAGSVPAALAGRARDDEMLKIERPGGPDPLTAVQPAGGVLPPAAVPAARTPPADALKEIELEALVKPNGDYAVEPDAAGYTCRARVPIGGDGPVRQYTGTGPTAADAIAEVVKNIKSDRGK